MSNFIKKYFLLLHPLNKTIKIMKKTTSKFLALSLLGLLSSAMAAQNLQQRQPVQTGRTGHHSTYHAQELTPSGHVRCLTTENEALLKAQYPNRATNEEFEAWLAPKIAQIKADREAGRDVQVVYNIPVVIHIVHNGDALGTGENITDAQARSQINVMNQDYRRMVGTPGGANTTGLAVDVEINFCLAQTDPSGNATTGIVRHNIAPYTNAVTNGAGGADWELRNDVEAAKAATIWNPSQYLNMWTFRFGGQPLASGGLEGLLGYAQFPDNSGLGGLSATNGAANTDGVTASFDAFGTIAENDGSFIMNGTYNLGRTMTHEVGHWLGLRHIWGDNSACPGTNTATDKDYVADTPAASAANYSCASVVNSCPLNPGNDMTQNYMDYTDDACMDTFTNGQKLRMVAVMQNSPRRNTLNASAACLTPTPIIQYTNPTGSINESSNCSYTDVTFPVQIGRAASANAVVTFNVTGGTATQGADYQIVNPTATFTAGTTTAQNLTVRVFHDGLAESAETITVGLTLNANGGDAVLNAGAASMTITIADNDTAPISTQNVTVFSETFDPTPNNALSVHDLDGDTENWGTSATYASATAIGFSSNFAFSQSWDGTTGLNPNNLLRTTNPIALPATGNLNLSFAIGTTQTAPYHLEHYAVYVTTSNVPATIIAQTPVHEATLATAASRNVINVNLNAFAGQSVYLTFRHFNTYDMNLIMLDDILITRQVATAVQTAVNTGTAYQVAIPAAGTSYAVDSATGRIMADVTSDNFNYGCTSVAVSRDQATAGAAAVSYNGNLIPANFVMAKRFTITPAANNASGNVTLKFYFTEAEIAAWEAATGKVRSALRVIKEGVGVPYAATIGAFGSNVTLTATVPSGLSGAYYFGSDSTLGASGFEVVNAVTVYPNPTQSELNINMSGDFGNTNYTIYNAIGQVIAAVKVNSQNDLKVNTSNYSNGIYFIKIEKEGSVKTLQFIKN